MVSVGTTLLSHLKMLTQQALVNISDSNAVIVTVVQVQNITHLSWIVHQQVVSCNQFSSYTSLASGMTLIG